MFLILVTLAFKYFLYEGIKPLHSATLLHACDPRLFLKVLQMKSYYIYTKNCILKWI